MKKTKIDEDFIENAINDGHQEAWENGELGKDEKHAKPIHLNVKSKSLPISIRLPPHLVESLKKLAEKEGIPYQTYLKMILTKHVRSKNQTPKSA